MPYFRLVLHVTTIKLTNDIKKDHKRVIQKQPNSYFADDLENTLSSPVEAKLFPFIAWVCPFCSVIYWQLAWVFAHLFMLFWGLSKLQWILKGFFPSNHRFTISISMNIFFVVLSQWDFVWRRPFSAFVLMDVESKRKTTSGGQSVLKR